MGSHVAIFNIFIPAFTYEHVTTSQNIMKV